MSNKKNNISNNYSAEIYAKTKKYQKIYGFGIGEGKHDAWNNEADAFKHTFALPLLNLYSALIFGISAKKYVSSHLHNGCAVAYSSTLSPIFILNGIKKLTSPFTSIGVNSTFPALITAFSISASSVNL